MVGAPLALGAFKAGSKGLDSHVLFWVRIMKRRVRTVAMPFLLSVLVLCLSKHCMLVQLLREKIAALSIYHVFWQLLLCDSLQRSSCYDTWVDSRNLYTSKRTEEGIAIVLTRRIGPTFKEVCRLVTAFKFEESERTTKVLKSDPNSLSMEVIGGVWVKCVRRDWRGNRFLPGSFV